MGPGCEVKCFLCIFFFYSKDPGDLLQVTSTLSQFLIRKLSRSNLPHLAWDSKNNFKLTTSSYIRLLTATIKVVCFTFPPLPNKSTQMGLAFPVFIWQGEKTRNDIKLVPTVLQKVRFSL